MENASKALLIAGAILLCILIIAIGMFIYNSAQSTITESMNSMSTQEIEAFNNQFSGYEGIQSGSNIKALMGRLIGNVDTYKDEATRVPHVYIDQANAAGTVKELDVTYASSDELSEYIKELGQIRNRVEAKHDYYVEATFQTNGLLDYLVISYNTDEAELADAKYRGESAGSGEPGEPG